MSRAGALTVIAGGQTGVDQAALRAAQDCGLATGGWCPPGRFCETGVIPERFPLRETPAERSSEAPEVPRSLRTAWNVRDADATLVLRPAAPVDPRADPGTDWALRCAERIGRPVLICDPADPEAAERLLRWLDDLPSIGTLLVAGPSERDAPGIGDRVYLLLGRVLSALRTR